MRPWRHSVWLFRACRDMGGRSTVAGHKKATYMGVWVAWVWRQCSNISFRVAGFADYLRGLPGDFFDAFLRSRTLYQKTSPGRTVRTTPSLAHRYIVCTEHECRAELTEEEFKLLAELVTAEIKRTEKSIGGTRRLGAA